MVKAVLLLMFSVLFSPVWAVDHEDYTNFKVIDKDQDFKVETVELRKWSEAYARIWSYDQWMAKEAFPLGDLFLTKIDDDKNKKISKTELRDFQNLLKPIFERAYTLFIEMYDANGNSRIENSELTKAHINYPKFTNFFTKNMNRIIEDELVAELDPNHVMLNEKQQKPEEGIKELRRKLDDIYD